MARLVGTSIREIQKERLAVASKAALDWNAVVLLKGARTVVADPGGAIYINPTGNPGMATAGSGDVLAGTIAALAGQGLNPSRAAAAGAYLHGLAGDLAAREKGMTGLVAGDLILTLPEAIRNLG
ncbi:MAG: Bifunctional NAD(P)H-hydrate repair enzyme Nnr [Firmicutes bacterium ADurb.Bin456]|nr:MAG: Bifunctional NAD(P)H-hydrate repair enzyme Nnr [Firmicutes bacterium ADurb.Bin456]